MLRPAIVYVPISVLNKTEAGMTNLIQIALKDSQRTSLEQARAEIDPNFEGAGIHVSGARSKAEFRSAVHEHVLVIYVFQVLASCIVAAVGGLGLITVMSINVFERRREIGVLRAIGGTPKMIRAIVIGEALTIATIAWGVGVVLAWPLTEVVAGMIGHLLHGSFDFRVAPVGIVIAFGACAAIAASASALAARSAVRITVRQALGYE
jgi:putative ABC transport system permease protein